MTSLGEWDDATPVYDLADAPETATEDVTKIADHVATVLNELDIASIAGGLVAQTVTREIQRQVQRQVAPVVKKAVTSVLTPERLDALREVASAAAEAELNPQEPGTQQPPDDAAPTLYYGSLDEFVREFICPTFRRNVGEEGRADYRWSARWWESAEAVTRLEAVWRAWEHLRLDPSTGTSVWLRDHADHHLGVLMSPTGPFARSTDTADTRAPLPYQPPPTGLFPDVRELATAAGIPPAGAGVEEHRTSTPL